MKWYDYTDLSIVSAKKPHNTHLFWEHSTYGLVLVDSADQTKLFISTDKGDNWAEIDLSDNANSYKIQSGYLDGNDLWLVMCDNDGTADDFEVCYVELDDSNDCNPIGVSHDAIADTVYVWDIWRYDSNTYVIGAQDEVASNGYLIVWDVDTHPFTKMHEEAVGDCLGYTDPISYGAIVGDNIYFMIDNAGCNNVALWYYDHSATTLNGREAGEWDYSLPSRTQQGLSYDGTDLIYFIANLDADGKDYLYHHSISEGGYTNLGEFDAALMLDRNTAAGVLEKAFNMTTDDIYQIRPRRDGIMKIAQPDSDAVWIGITDSYLMNDDGDMFEYADAADEIDICEIDYKMGNVTLAKISMTNNLPILTSIVLYDPSDVLIFQGIVVEKIYTDANLYHYNATSYDSEILSYKFSNDQTAGDTDAAAIIEEVLDGADWLYYDSSITSPTINVKADFVNITFKDFMDTMADRCDYVWYVAPDGKVFFNDGTTASGNAVTHTSGIMSEPKIKLIGSQINKVILYGGTVTGVRLTSTAEDADAQTLYGVIEYIDHFPHITDQTELDTLSAKILSRSGMDDNPYYVDDELFGQEFIQCGTTIDFTFTPLSFAQDNLILLNYIYNAKADHGKYKLSTGLVQNLWRGYGVFDKKTKTADEEQIDILAALVEDQVYSDGKAVAAVSADDAYLKNDANDETTGDLTVANLITAGNVDGRDISADINQAVKTTDSPTFVGLTLSADLITTSTIDGTDVAALKTDCDLQATAAEAIDAVEAAALIMTGSMELNGANITCNAGETVDGKDVSGLCTTAEAHAYVEATALTMTEDITFNAGQTFDGEDVSALATDLGNQATAAEAIDAVEAAALIMTGSMQLNGANITCNAGETVDGVDVSQLIEQSAAFPGAPSEGDFHYDEDDDSLYRYNGEAEAWVEVGTMGAIASSTDNLGNHTATETLDLDGNLIDNVSHIVSDGDIYFAPLNNSTDEFVLTHLGGHTQIYQEGATVSAEAGHLGVDAGVSSPFNVIMSHFVYNDDGTIEEYSEVDDLQLLRDVKIWNVRQKVVNDKYPDFKQNVFDVNTLPWVKAHPDVNLINTDNSEKRYMSTVNQKIGYLLSTMKKILEKIDIMELKIEELKVDK